MTISVYRGDCFALMPHIAADSIDSCVTDPPYHLTTGKKGGTGPKSLNLKSPAGRSRISTGFMGKAWDGGDIAFQPALWAEVFRVLKPGAHLLAFSGTRTQHRMVCAIEDAGFEIRDQIGWVYGSGFPKSHDISKAAGAEHAAAWEGWGTALKPAWEPICVARMPFKGTVADNVIAHGTGGLNIDGCRVGWPDGIAPEIGTPAWGGPSKMLTVVPGQQGATVARTLPSQLGRFPANLIHDGSDEVLACFPDAPGALSPVAGHEESTPGWSGGLGRVASLPVRGDSGSAARFFYCAKASTAERGGSDHPTVKPLALMRYLVRLVTPPKGLVLDPFAGSGTTGVACQQEDVNGLLIEQDAAYCAQIMQRLKAREAA